MLKRLILLAVLLMPGSLIQAEDTGGPTEAANATDSAKTTSEYERIDEQAQSWLREERFAELERLCGSWLSRLEREYGEQSIELSSPLICLGTATYGQDKFAKAVPYNRRAIRLIEEQAGPFDPRLVAPLEALGATRMALQQFEVAEAVLERAKIITHRNMGIFNLDQTPILNRLTMVYLRQKNVNAANREQRFLLQAHEQTYGDTPPLTPALRRFGRYYENSIGRSDLAREQYRRALEILEQSYGPNDLRLVPPLKDIAESFTNAPRSVRVMSGEGTKALYRIIELYEAQEFVDRADLAGAYTDLGDWYITSGQRSRARRAYTRSWEVFSNDNELLGTRSKIFDKPVLLDYEAKPVSWSKRQILKLPSGTVEVVFDFTVDAKGRVQDIVLVKDDIKSHRVVASLRANVRSSRYRPRFENGVPVATPNVRKVLRFNFESQKRLLLEGLNTPGESSQNEVNVKELEGDEAGDSPPEEESTGEQPANEVSTDDIEGE